MFLNVCFFYPRIKKVIYIILMVLIMLLQNNCINNGITNDLEKRKKNMQTALYSKQKERRETGGEWLIGANTQIIPYL